MVASPIFDNFVIIIFGDIDFFFKLRVSLNNR